MRGSCPCPSDANARYGGNTASVALEVDGEQPILFDLGTGLRQLGATMPMDETFCATALVTHIHWDHVQGLPFFAPIHTPGARLDVYGPNQEEGTLAEEFGGLMRPPYFPIHFTELQGDVTFHGVTNDELAIGNAKVMVRPVPHVGPTVGYRVEWNGVKIAYISDHQAPRNLDTIDPAVLELADGVDLLIHDAQYTPEEFEKKFYWGHCTVDYALMVAKHAGAHTLAMFHHDPAHSDDEMDGLVEQAKGVGGRMGVPEVIGTYEGMVLNL